MMSPHRRETRVDRLKGNKSLPVMQVLVVSNNQMAKRLQAALTLAQMILCPLVKPHKTAISDGR